MSAKNVRNCGKWAVTHWALKNEYEKVLQTICYFFLYDLSEYLSAERVCMCEKKQILGREKKRFFLARVDVFLCFVFLFFFFEARTQKAVIIQKGWCQCYTILRTWRSFEDTWDEAILQFFYRFTPYWRCHLTIGISKRISILRIFGFQASEKKKQKYRFTRCLCCWWCVYVIEICLKEQFSTHKHMSISIVACACVCVRMKKKWINEFSYEQTRLASI